MACQTVFKAQEVFEELGEIIAEQLCIDKSEVCLNSRFNEDLNVDSLDMVEVIMEAEDTFGIEISEEEAQELATVEQAMKLVTGKLVTQDRLSA